VDTLRKGPTASENLENALSALPLQTLSDEELAKVRAILSLKLSEADFVIKGREHFKTHHCPKSK